MKTRAATALRVDETHEAPVVSVDARRSGSTPAHSEEVAEETAVAFSVNGVSQAVMMASPLDLDDFAYGFALTQGWIEQRHQLLDIETQRCEAGIALELHVTAACEHRLKVRRRALAGTTGCGLCGIESLRELHVPQHTLATAAPLQLTHAAVTRAARGLSAAQPLHQRCGGMHGAAWCSIGGDVLIAREDVGRHNALDKLIGALLRANAARSDGFVLMSSRASYELVEKVSAADIGALACVSAPTALAIRTAQARGVSLWSFVRGDSAVQYA